MQRPVILVSNDDSINAPGIKALVEVAKKFGDVVVVAPDSPQSGMGHAITIHEPLRLHKVEVFEGVESYQCSGTPADCVKIAIDKVLYRLPDLCISGINHGSNASINVIYSGTMSAAMEAAISSVPAIGFSLLDFSFDADFEASKHYAEIVIREFFNNGLPDACLLNVNIPKLPLEEIKGMKVCRQAVAKWEEEFEKRVDPNGNEYFWLTGNFVNYDKGEDTDVWALENNFVSIVPVQYDLTNYQGITHINKNWNISNE